MISRDTFNTVNHAFAGFHEACWKMFQKADTVSPAQPIPAPPTVQPATPSTDVADDKDTIDNDDSITEEITDLRIAESSHKEWVRVLLFPILSYLVMLLMISVC